MRRTHRCGSGEPATHHEHDDLLLALGDTDRLREQVEHLVATNHSLAALLLNTDTRSAGLLKLLVSVRALIASRDAAAALDGVCDILVNVVGTTEFLIYSIDAETDCLIPIAGKGEVFQSAVPISLRSSWLGDVVLAGDVLIVPPRAWSAKSQHDANVTAVVPLRVLDRVVGGIMIARILPHRELLDLCDREVLGLLGAYAATAIIAAERRSEWSELPVALQ